MAAGGSGRARECSGLVMMSAKNVLIGAEEAYWFKMDKRTFLTLEVPVHDC